MNVLDPLLSAIGVASGSTFEKNDGVDSLARISVKKNSKRSLASAINSFFNLPQCCCESERTILYFPLATNKV